MFKRDYLKLGIWHLFSNPHLLEWSLYIWMDFTHVKMLLVIYCERTHLNPWVHPACFFAFISNCSNDVPKPSTKTGINSNIHHSISRVQKCLFCNVSSHLQITMNSTSTKQGPPNRSIWFTGHHLDQIHCMHIASPVKEVNYAGVVLQCCRNSVNWTCGFKAVQALMH